MKFNFVGLNEKQTLAVRELSATLGFEIDAEGTKVKVVAGDNLSSIAKKFNTTWQKLYQLNKEMIDRDARAHGVKEHFENYIYPGQVLKLK